jgi:hypothetical protein
MSGATARLLNDFDALPEEERRIFALEVLRRSVPFDSGPLDDQETARSADELLALLDAEENDARSR